MSETTVWDHEEHHWWGPVECDGLFLIFDTSAHMNGGVPDVHVDEVIEHIRECEWCRGDGDVRVSGQPDGKYVLENCA